MQTRRFRPNEVREAGSLDYIENRNGRGGRSVISDRGVRKNSIHDDLFEMNKQPLNDASNGRQSDNEAKTKIVRSRKDFSNDEIEEIKADSEEEKEREKENERQRRLEKQKRKERRIKAAAEEAKLKSFDNEAFNREDDDRTTTGDKKRVKNKEDVDIGIVTESDNGQLAYNSTSTAELEMPKYEQFPNGKNPFIVKGKSKIDKSELKEMIDEIHKPYQDAQIIEVDENNEPSTTKKIQENNFNLDYFKNIQTLDFLLNPAPEGLMVRARVSVDSNIIASDKYSLHLEGYSKEDQPLLFTTSKTKTAGIYLVLNGTIMHHEEENKVDIVKLGKIKSNMTKTKYRLVGMEDEETTKSEQQHQKETKLVDIAYNAFLITTNPKPKEMEIRVRNQEKNDKENRKSKSTYFDMVSKTPEYDKASKIYKLNFKGRASMASTNNFQIIDPLNEKEILLQMGKTGKGEYILDFTFPFSPLTAFSVGLSSLTRS